MYEFSTSLNKTFIYIYIIYTLTFIYIYIIYILYILYIICIILYIHPLFILYCTFKFLYLFRSWKKINTKKRTYIFLSRFTFPQKTFFAFLDFSLADTNLFYRQEDKWIILFEWKKPSTTYSIAFHHLVLYCIVLDQIDLLSERKVGE